MRHALGFIQLTVGLWCLQAFPLMGWACPWCKDALFAPGESAARAGAAQGYAWSIGLLLLVPSSLIVGIGVLLARASRKQFSTTDDSGSHVPR